MKNRSSIASLLFSLLISCHGTVNDASKASGKDSLESGTPAMAYSGGKDDSARFNKLLLHLVHGKANQKWPVKTSVPLPGSILPYKRIVAYYGNFLSPGMGVLGAYPEEVMLARLHKEVESWQQADTVVKIQPAIHYVAVTAQDKPGKEGKYRLRMPFSEIDKALRVANKINAILFLDVQIGLSSLPQELPVLEPYLKLPNVHLGIDPEYSMKNGKRPCTAIGYYDAEDVNYASKFLEDLSLKYDLPPKILVVHRFTKQMLTRYKQIILRPHVQIVIHMDGFGFPAKKVDSYIHAVTSEPVQFTGFKLFYQADKVDKPYRLMEPAEILELYPSPSYIQYQ